MGLTHDMTPSLPHLFAGLSERVSLFLLELRPSVLEASRPGGSTSRRAPPPDAEPVLVFLAAPASLSPDATPLGREGGREGGRDESRLLPSSWVGVAGGGGQARWWLAGA